MTLFRFREGDVLCVDGVEEPVERVNEDFIVTICANRARRSLCRRTVERGGLPVSLLRRPVREGDVIVHGYGTALADPRRVSHVYSDMFKFEGGAQMWLKDVHGFGAWRHGDGTPIDPPKVSPGVAVAIVRAREVTNQEIAHSLKRGETCIYNDHASATLRADGSILLRAVGVEMTIGKDGVLWSEPTNDDGLVRRLFVTDPEVIAYVRSRSDNLLRSRVTRWNTALGREETVEDTSPHPMREGKFESDKHMQTAWDLGKAGKMPEAAWHRRATERAKAMQATTIGGGR